MALQLNTQFWWLNSELEPNIFGKRKKVAKAWEIIIAAAGPTTPRFAISTSPKVNSPDIIICIDPAIMIALAGEYVSPRPLRIEENVQYILTTKKNGSYEAQLRAENITVLKLNIYKNYLFHKKTRNEIPFCQN